MTKLERYPIKGAGAMKGQLDIRRRSWIDAPPVIWFYKRILSPFGVEHPKAAAGIARLRRQLGHGHQAQPRSPPILLAPVDRMTRFKIGAVTDEPLSAIFTWLLENADDDWSASIGNDQDNPHRLWLNTDSEKLVLLFKMRWR